jgi:pyruvate/2-oxoglutarate dehydrogenase complex dihydrolipoamide dehydrogenase (E3) component
MSTERVQNLIIGSGVAGKLLGWTFASQGQKTAVIEHSMVGGSCPNVACLPSKNVIYSAKAVSLVHPRQGLSVKYLLKQDLVRAGTSRDGTARVAGGGRRQQAGAIRPSAGEPEGGQFLKKNRP